MAWFTDADLRALAGGRSYERGLDYVDVVGDVGELPDGVVAAVHGTGRYRVRLTGSGGGVLAGRCSCPHGQEGNFCKHCVAVGLLLLREAGPGRQPRSRGKGRSKARKVDVKTFLTAMDHAELVELVWEHASEDAVLFRKLRLRAATAADGPDLAELRGQVERLRTQWVGYGEGEAYAGGAEQVLRALDRLVPAHAAAVQPLLRAAVRHIGAAAGACEDDAGSIVDVADAAWTAYLRACAAAPPEPVEFARWYADSRLDGPEWPETGLGDVVELLGAAGLAAYRQRLDEAMRTHPGHWRLRAMREELVAATGDTDAMVSCLAEDLSGPHRYVRIAALLHEHGRTAEAIDWLERGSAAGESAYDHRMQSLVDMLAELYAESGRTADVVALREKHFVAVGSQQAYQALRSVARDTPQWPDVRSRALASLTERANRGGWFASDTLAAVLLDEGEIDQAWQVTQTHQCGAQVRLAVTARRAESHPADAIAVYRPMVEAAIAQTNTSGYAQATQLLLAMRPLCARTGDDFAGYVGVLKETHRRKRNLLAELSRNGL